MKILFAASECYPFFKTGGLADVAYALPKALRKLGIDARVILPKYNDIKDEFKNSMIHKGSFNVPVGWRNKFGDLEYLEYDTVPFYFIDNEYYFKRGGAYGYYDDGERFSYFSRAILQAIYYMDDFNPDIIHCNDWQTAMVPVLLKDLYRDSPSHKNINTVYTIHNLRYQGVFGEDMLHELLNLNSGYYNEEALKFYDGISFMKGGINFSDRITTVSYSYAEEIQTSAYGEKLEGLLRYQNSKLQGIVNGIDYDLYNPSRDKDIYLNYDSLDISNKVINKTSLQRDLSLPEDGDIPMIGIVSRLVSQKGFDLIKDVIEEILQENLQLVVLGTGQQQYEDMFKFFKWKYPSKVSANILFDNNLAQKIYAASDMFLMPSLFEPCGIGQLIALRYGSLPIVRETGGLKDTVHSYNENTHEGNGFSFANYNAHDMLYTIKRALNFYHNKDIWNRLVVNAMNEDNSWNNSANKYAKLYSEIL